MIMGHIIYNKYTFDIVMCITINNNLLYSSIEIEDNMQ